MPMQFSEWPRSSIAHSSPIPWAKVGVAAAPFLAYSILGFNAILAGVVPPIHFIYVY